jgi:hypothetical protein
VLLVFGAPCQLRMLAGQEHGRTIPLADPRPAQGGPANRLQRPGARRRGSAGGRRSRPSCSGSAIATCHRWRPPTATAGRITWLRRATRRSARDVWIAALSATAGFMVERRKLAQKPLLQIKVRDVVDLEAETAAQPRQEGYTLKEVTTILTTTVATPGT